MTQHFPATTIAGCYALAAFAVAIISGLAADAPASEILANAILALMLCYFLGIIAAKVFRVILDEYQRSLEKHTQTTAPDPSSAPLEHPAHIG